MKSALISLAFFLGAAGSAVAAESGSNNTNSSNNMGSNIGNGVGNGMGNGMSSGAGNGVSNGVGNGNLTINAAAAPLSANVNVFVTGHVTELEASYLPNAVGFFMDAGYSGCPAGTYLQWRGPNNDGNPNVVPFGFDMLTAAVANGTRVGVTFSTGCTVHYLYILPP
jgi:hypothetical protein